MNYTNDNEKEFLGNMKAFYEQMKNNEALSVDYFYSSLKNIGMLTGRSLVEMSSDLGKSNSYIKTTLNNYRKTKSRKAYATLVDLYGYFLEKVSDDDRDIQLKLEANLYSMFTGIVLPEVFEYTFYLKIEPKPYKKRKETNRSSETKKQIEEHKQRQAGYVHETPIKTKANNNEIEVTNIATGETVVASNVPDGFIQFYEKLHDVLGVESSLRFGVKNEQKVIKW